MRIKVFNKVTKGRRIHSIQEALSVPNKINISRRQRIESRSLKLNSLVHGTVA